MSIGPASIGPTVGGGLLAGARRAGRFMAHQHWPGVGVARVLIDAWGVGLGSASRCLLPAPGPLRAVLGTAVAVASGVPAVRRVVESSWASTSAGLPLAVANTAAQALSQGPWGCLADLARDLLALAEVPEVAPPHSEEVAPVPRRPVELPDGVVERYAAAAWKGSCFLALAAMAGSGDLPRAASILVAGVPKAALYGRESFAVAIGRVLAGRGVEIRDVAVLRLLDRIDCLVIAPGMAEDDRSAVVQAAARFGLEVVVDVAEPLADAIRHHQEGGRVVCLVGPVGGVGSADCAVADCAVAVGAGVEAGPAASLVCPGTGQVQLFLCALEAARSASQRSVTIAMVGAGIGAFSGLVGPPGRLLRPGDTPGVAALVAMSSAVLAALRLDRAYPHEDADPVSWQTLGTDEVVERLETRVEGLTGEEAARRLAPAVRQPGRARRLAAAVGAEMGGPFAPVLAAGAGLQAATGSGLDALLVGGVVGLGGLAGGFQRLRSERAVAALGPSAREQVWVRRPDGERPIEPERLVRGDVIRLGAGNAVPVDCRILVASGVEVDEAAVSGESLPVGKTSAASKERLAERSSMLFEGTSVLSGEAVAVVVATGEETELRRAAAGSPTPVETGVAARVRQLSEIMLPAVGVGALACVAVGVLRGVPGPRAATAAVSLAVAAIPEGLPLLATAAELSAARRLARRRILVRYPRAIEALGRVQVMCFDKTGTLTMGCLRLALVSDGTVEETPEAASGERRRALRAAMRASPQLTAARHPTDRVIVAGGRRAAVTTDEDGWRRAADLAFESSRGYSASLGELPSAAFGRAVLSAKGSPETILSRCSRVRRGARSDPLGPARKAHLVAEAERLASLGFRVLAAAERHVAGLVGPGRRGRAPGDETGEVRVLDVVDVADLTFLGFLALADPVRPGASVALAQLRRAGIKLVLVTGDHPGTARRVACELGLAGGAQSPVVSGDEIEHLGPDQLVTAVAGSGVFARVTPSQKALLVARLQGAGFVVAVTGDGSNDAAAIRHAEVGVAFGASATPAARRAADLVLLDEGIGALVEAVGEARSTWLAVRDAVGLLVGGNLGEVGFILAGTLVGGAVPLLPRQLLLVNLLTDVLPALAIATRPVPRRSVGELLAAGPDILLGDELGRLIRRRALCTGAGASLAWLVVRPLSSPGRARTVGLVALVGGQLGQTLIIGRGSRPVLVAMGLSAGVLATLVSTPGLSHLFGCRPLGPIGWTAGIAGALAATGGGLLLELGRESDLRR